MIEASSDLSEGCRKTSLIQVCVSTPTLPRSSLKFPTFAQGISPDFRLLFSNNRGLRASRFKDFKDSKNSENSGSYLSIFLS